jgi:hypothetical protein
MKHKSFCLMSLALIVIPSLACSLFTGGDATPSPTGTTTPDYIFEPVTAPLKFEPDPSTGSGQALPNAQTGVEYEAEIRVSDNVTPVFSMTVSDGTLPAGLELIYEDGVDGATIRGVPEEAGTFTFTISAACFGTMVSGQVGEKEYVIAVE